MAKKTAKPAADDARVAVIAGCRFKHDGLDVWPRDIVRLTTAEAADMVALRMVRYATPDEAAT